MTRRLLAALVLAAFAAACGPATQPPPPPPQARLIALELLSSGVVFPVGASVQLWAYGRFDDGSSRRLEQGVAYSSSDEAFAPVSASGEVVLRRAGEFRIEARSAELAAPLLLTAQDVALAQVSIFPIEDVVLVPGAVKAFQAFATYADGRKLEITSQADWSASGPSLRRVAGGDFQALTPGPVAVQVSFGGKSARKDIRVRELNVEHLWVDATEHLLRPGQQATFKAMALIEGGTEQDVSALAVWRSDKPAVATVDEAGRVHALAEGRAVIRASYGGLNAQQPVDVPGAQVVSLRLPSSELQVVKGREAELTVEAVLEDGRSFDVSADALWTSGEECLSVYGRRVRALEEGRFEVVARYDRFTASLWVEVLPPTLDELKLNFREAMVGLNNPIGFRVYGVYSDGATQDVTVQAVWSVLGPLHLELLDGYVAGRASAYGEAQVTFEYAGRRIDAALHLTPLPLRELRVEQLNDQLTCLAVFEGRPPVSVTELCEWTAEGPFVSNEYGSKGRLTFPMAGGARIGARFMGMLQEITLP